MELNKYKIVDKNYSKRKLYIGKKINKLFIHDIVRVMLNTGRLETMVIASCDCNPDKKIMTKLFPVLNGRTKSCGCYRSQNTSKMNLKKNTSIKYLGKKFITNQGYTIEVIAVTGRHDVTVKFLDTKKGEEYETHTTIQNAKKGQVRYPYHRNKWGGYYGVGKYSARINNEKTICYNKWIGMLCRCYDKNGIYYKKVKVYKEWKNFQNFAEWYYANTYELKSGELIDMDKDLLSFVSNKKKIYSPDTCLLVPRSINIELIGITEGYTKEKIDALIEHAKTYESEIPIETYTKLICSLNKLYEKNKCSF